ncbi:MAG TPA: VaFE repeat-containing surface-anchored protein, partial [Bacteroidales bacterium]|nr:VaFE repeat-containing surface-anchored protein [Bacteroidales bacterium]
IYLDAEGNEVRNSVTFTPETESGFVEVPFSFPVEQRAISVVAAEKVRHENEENYVGIHYDLTDENQEVDFPGIHTTLLNNVTEEHIAPNMGTITLVDTVTYENIVPNLEYTLYGTIMIRETNSPLRDSEGNIVEIRRTFTPTTSTGDVEVEFTINTAELEGKTLVAFETLEYNGVTLVVHADINDEDQTVYVPDVHTTAVDSVDNDKIIDGASHEQTIIDTVAYTNLIPGITYTVTGKLVVKKDYAEGEEYEYVKDADGNIITSSTTFTPTTANGSVDVIFTIDASIYAGEQIVVFEDVYYNNNLIISHSDINDEDQTIEISLLLHVKIAKADKDNVAYYLRDAEITIFNADGTIAYDVEGNPCVGITNENGEVEFTLVYDRENTYYAQETKAPSGYSINSEKFEITPTSDRESEGTCVIPVTILDTIIIIPPKTGDNMNLGLYIMLTVLSTCGLAGGCFYFFKRRKKKHNA